MRPLAALRISSVRESRSSSNAVVFVVASKAKDSEQALERGAHFLLRLPIDATEMGSYRWAVWQFRTMLQDLGDRNSVGCRSRDDNPS